MVLLSEINPAKGWRFAYTTASDIRNNFVAHFCSYSDCQNNRKHSTQAPSARGQRKLRPRSLMYVYNIIISENFFYAHHFPAFFLSDSSWLAWCIRMPVFRNLDVVWKAYRSHVSFLQVKRNFNFDSTLTRKSGINQYGRPISRSFLPDDGDFLFTVAIGSYFTNPIQ